MTDQRQSHPDGTYYVHRDDWNHGGKYVIHYYDPLPEGKKYPDIEWCFNTKTYDTFAEADAEVQRLKKYGHLMAL